MAVKLFSYQRGNTLLHRIPALAKLIFIILFCILVCRDLQGQALVAKDAACILLILILFFSAGHPFRSLIELWPVLVIGAFVTVCRSIDFFPLSFVKEGLFDGLRYTFNFLISSLACSLVFRTTSSLKIMDALETVQDCIAKIFPPINKLNPALLISMTISFIPMVFETWNKVALAVKAREHAGKRNHFSLRILSAQFSALFSCLLYKAETARKAILNRSGE